MCKRLLKIMPDITLAYAMMNSCFIWDNSTMMRSLVLQRGILADKH